VIVAALRRRITPARNVALRVSALLGLAAVLAPALGATGASAAPPLRAVARAAKVLAVRDRAELHRVRTFGETLIEEGKTTGTLAGTVKIRLNIDSERGTASAEFTLYLSGATLTGHSSGKANGGRGGWESFSGKMWLTRGTGRYAHASGSGNMYGAIYRRTDRLIVQEYGQLRY
jgi:hypothetical protein